MTVIPRKDRAVLLVELMFVVLVIASVIYTFVFLFWKGYLPHPYFYGSQSFFTDWTASAYYAVNPGAYTAFYSVYPPLSFVFLRIFSLHTCYRYDIFLSRSCDWLSLVAMAGFYFATIPVVYKSYQIVDRQTAWMRTAGICLGLPILYAIERGNLIVPTFFFFALGHGRVLRSARLRWLCLAISINFKPYLITTIFGHLVKRRWRWFEGVAITGLLVYLVTFMLEGDGDPITVLTNISQFATSDPRGIFERATYASSYLPVRDLLPSHFPLMHFIGSQPIEILEWLLPLMINLGKLGVLATYVGALWRPKAVPVFRLAALGLCWVLTVQDPGGYAVVFLLFLVFMEPWRGVGCIIAIVCGYILSISWDYTVVLFAKEFIESYLTNQVVIFDLGATVGMMTRPALVIFIEYALIGTSLVSIFRATPSRPSGRVAGPASPLRLATG